MSDVLELIIVGFMSGIGFKGAEWALKKGKAVLKRYHDELKVSAYG